MLELAIARALFDRFPEFSEGRMAKIRSHVVSRASCAIVSRELELGDRLLAESDGPPSGEVTRLSQNRNVLAALLEAALAALYLAHGFEPIAEAIVEAFDGQIEFALTSQFDHKTDLQERLARTGRAVNYTVLEVAGPAARPHVHRGGADRLPDRRNRHRPLEEGRRAGGGAAGAADHRSSRRCSCCVGSDGVTPSSSRSRTRSSS